MAIYKLPYSDLNQLFAAIAANEKLYLPVDISEDEAAFRLWKEGDQMTKKLNTLRSAKDFFFPQVQPLAKFRRQGQTIEIMDDRTESEDFVIFGARACDVRSFDVLDRVFLEEPVDTQYQTRRQHSTVISLACGRPGETCFCGSFGIDAAKAGGDVQAWHDGDNFYLEPLTDKGVKLIDSVSSLLTAGDQEAVDQVVEKIHTILARLPLAGLKPQDLRDKELETFNSPKWDELSSHCIGCGSCTFVCPTCQCFDIEDFKNGENVERYRCWDSCMYNEFTMMAAGTPRKTQKERFRQRFMHKLVYYPIKNDGMYSCVGCGRCLRKCPIQMNIVKVMKALEEEA
jgi:sulfhydrogenase subunit beta (sulfur reductase)